MRQRNENWRATQRWDTGLWSAATCRRFPFFFVAGSDCAREVSRREESRKRKTVRQGPRPLREDGYGARTATAAISNRVAGVARDSLYWGRDRSCVIATNPWWQIVAPSFQRTRHPSTYPNRTAMPTKIQALRPPAEVLFAEELAALEKADKYARPPGWKLSPKAVRAFICGVKNPPIQRKFFGDDVLIERAIIGLAGNRGLLLVGEPGTAKSMLSELLAAAISSCSTNTIQGSSGTTEDQIKYSWNYALLLAEGPSRRALVPGPLHVGMSQGLIVRFEEVTRCPPEIQDVLISIISEKLMMVPELEGSERVLLAQPGFNIIATANIRDRGVHEMSSALKRRFNFETVHPIAELDQEVTLVSEQCGRLLAESDAPVEITRDVVELLVTAFHHLREGVTADGV